MLGLLLHAPRGPFYSPKAARSRWRKTWKAILAFCRVAHRTATVACPVRDCLPDRAQVTVIAPGPLAHRTLSGAHQTVRCPLPTVGAATRRAKIVRPTVGTGDHWVNYSHIAPLLFPRATSSPGMTHRIVRCTTGQSDEL
jgi:hypothetical protein